MGYVYKNITDFSKLKGGLYFDKSKNVNRLKEIAAAFQAKEVKVSDEVNTIVKVLGNTAQDKRLDVVGGELLVDWSNNFIEECTVINKRARSGNISVGKDNAGQFAFSGTYALADLRLTVDPVPCYRVNNKNYFGGVLGYFTDKNNSDVGEKFGEGNQIGKTETSPLNGHDSLYYYIPKFSVENIYLNGYGRTDKRSIEDDNYRHDFVYPNNLKTGNIEKFNFIPKVTLLWTNLFNIYSTTDDLFRIDGNQIKIDNTFYYDNIKIKKPYSFILAERKPCNEMTLESYQGTSIVNCAIANNDTQFFNNIINSKDQPVPSNTFNYLNEKDIIPPPYSVNTRLGFQITNTNTTITLKGQLNDWNFYHSTKNTDSFFWVKDFKESPYDGTKFLFAKGKHQNITFSTPPEDIKQDGFSSSELGGSDGMNLSWAVKTKNTNFKLGLHFDNNMLLYGMREYNKNYTNVKQTHNILYTDVINLPRWNPNWYVFFKSVYCVDLTKGTYSDQQWFSGDKKSDDPVILSNNYYALKSANKVSLDYHDLLKEVWNNNAFVIHAKQEKNIKTEKVLEQLKFSSIKEDSDAEFAREVHNTSAGWKQGFLGKRDFASHFVTCATEMGVALNSHENLNSDLFFGKTIKNTNEDTNAYALYLEGEDLPLITENSNGYFLRSLEKKNTEGLVVIENHQGIQLANIKYNFNNSTDSNTILKNNIFPFDDHGLWVRYGNNNEIRSNRKYFDVNDFPFKAYSLKMTHLQFSYQIDWKIPISGVSEIIVEYNGYTYTTKKTEDFIIGLSDHSLEGEPCYISIKGNNFYVKHRWITVDHTLVPDLSYEDTLVDYISLQENKYGGTYDFKNNHPTKSMRVSGVIKTPNSNQELYTQTTDVPSNGSGYFISDYEPLENLRNMKVYCSVDGITGDGIDFNKDILSLISFTLDVDSDAIYFSFYINNPFFNRMDSEYQCIWTPQNKTSKYSNGTLDKNNNGSYFIRENNDTKGTIDLCFSNQSYREIWFSWEYEIFKDTNGLDNIKILSPAKIQYRE